jgi:hypothetical protein
MSRWWQDRLERWPIEIGSECVLDSDRAGSDCARSSALVRLLVWGRNSMIEFSEGGDNWMPMPEWAGFCVELGYRWCHAPHAPNQPRPRRICLLSMPADSAAAGLVALGALRADLEKPDANDVADHYARIKTLANKRDSKTLLKRRRNVANQQGWERNKWRLDGHFPCGTPIAIEILDRPHRHDRSTNRRVGISCEQACNWCIDGEPPIRAGSEASIPYSPIYASLIADAQDVQPTNLATSHSCLCFAGRKAGESAARATIASIGLRSSNSQADLSALLTIASWSPTTASRMTFYNTRTGSLDRPHASLRLVIADGDAAFLEALDKPEFQAADVIGVAHRISDRPRLEALVDKLEALRQWFQVDPEPRGNARPRPAGISMLSLTERSS